MPNGYYAFNPLSQTINKMAEICNFTVHMEHSVIISTLRNCVENLKGHMFSRHQ